MARSPPPDSALLNPTLAELALATSFGVSTLLLLELALLDDSDELELLAELVLLELWLLRLELLLLCDDALDSLLWLDSELMLDDDCELRELVEDWLLSELADDVELWLLVLEELADERLDVLDSELVEDDDRELSDDKLVGELADDAELVLLLDRDDTLEVDELLSLDVELLLRLDSDDVLDRLLSELVELLDSLDVLELDRDDGELVDDDELAELALLVDELLSLDVLDDD